MDVRIVTALVLASLACLLSAWGLWRTYGWDIRHRRRRPPRSWRRAAYARPKKLRGK